MIGDGGAMGVVVGLGVQLFKDNQGGAINGAGVKLEDDVYAAVCSIGSELLDRSDRLAVVQQRRGFVSVSNHDSADHNVGLAGDKLGVGNSVLEFNLGQSIIYLGIVVSKLGGGSDAGVVNVNGLGFGVDVGMLGELLTLLSQSLEDYEIAIFEAACIECEVNDLFLILCRGSEGDVGNNRLAIYQDLLAGSLVHENALKDILGVNDQVLAGHFVADCYGCGIEVLSLADIVLVVGFGPDCRVNNLDGLVGVIDVLVLCQNGSAVCGIQSFENNELLAANQRGIEGKGDLYLAVSLCCIKVS